MLLGYKITLDTMENLVEQLTKVTESLHIVSGNPEVLYQGMKNEKLSIDFKREDSLIIPDGIGVCYPLRWRGYNVQRVAGIDLVVKLLERFEEKGKSVYLLGGTSDVNAKMVDYVKTNYPHVKVVGAKDGFFEDEQKVVEEIRDSKPDLLLVAMGAPRQELFIVNHRSELKCSLMMGVGGTFDVLVGKVERAPQWAIRLNLEWLYRIVKEPVRLKRFKSNIVFVLICLKEQFILSENKKIT